MMTEKRTLTLSALRSLCIEKNWMTRSTNDEYFKMLHYADEKKNVTTATIVMIARTIKQYSDTDYDMSSICFEIADRCHSFFEGNE